MESLYATYSDDYLLQLLSEDDNQAFTEIYNRYWAKLFYLTGKKIGDLQESENIVQDIFLDLWNRRAALDIQNLEGYLVVATRYRVINYLAKLDLLKKTQTNRYEQQDLSTENWVAFADMKHWLEEMVATLPQQCKLAYELRDAGYSYKEIATVMSISEKTVENHIGKALKTLRIGMSKLFVFFLFL